MTMLAGPAPLTAEQVWRPHVPVPEWADDVVVGTVYLLHFTDPVTGQHARFGHAGHYLGWAHLGRLDARLAEHGTPRGAKLLGYAREAGLSWELARTWEGTRKREALLKAQGGHSRKCPMCGIVPQVT